MVHQLVDFPVHQLVHFPTSYSPNSTSPLLNNSLLQTNFLMQHVLLPTLYATLTEPETSFENKTKKIDYFITENNKIINVINHNLAEIIKKRSVKEGRIPGEDNEEKCRRKTYLGYSITVAQESLVDLQEEVASKMHNRSSDKGVRSLLESVLAHMKMQRESLGKIKDFQMKKTEEEEKTRKKRAITTCMKPYFPVGNECFYVSHEEKLGWHDAISACHGYQGHLAEPENPRALVAVLKTINGRFKRAWIGGSDEEDDGGWKWLSGGSLSDSPEWRPGQPSNHSRTGEQRCLILLRNTPYGEPPFANFACWMQRAYICETEPEC